MYIKGVKGGREGEREGGREDSDSIVTHTNQFSRLTLRHRTDTLPRCTDVPGTTSADAEPGGTTAYHPIRRETPTITMTTTTKQEEYRHGTLSQNATKAGGYQGFIQDHGSSSKMKPKPATWV